MKKILLIGFLFLILFSDVHAQTTGPNFKLQVFNSQGQPVDVAYKISRIDGGGISVRTGKTGSDGTVGVSLNPGRYEVKVGTVQLPPLEIKRGEMVEKVVTYDPPISTRKASTSSSRRSKNKGIGLPFFLAIFGAITTWSGLHNLKMKRLIQRLPKTPLSSLQPGLVEMHGRVKSAGAQNLVAPLSKKECVYYDFYVEEERGKHDKILANGRAEQPFWVTDGGNSVLVDPKGNAEIEIKPKLKGSTGGFNKVISPEIQKFLDEKGIKQKSFLGFNRTIRYEETTLVPGDELFIIGTAKPLTQTLPNKPQDAITNLMIGDGSKKSIFYISDRSEERLLAKFSKKAFWKIPVGLLVFFGGLALIAALFI